MGMFWSWFDIHSHCFSFIVFNKFLLWPVISTRLKIVWATCESDIFILFTVAMNSTDDAKLELSVRGRRWWCSFFSHQLKIHNSPISLPLSLSIALSLPSCLCFFFFFIFFLAHLHLTRARKQIHCFFLRKKVNTERDKFYAFFICCNRYIYKIYAFCLFSFASFVFPLVSNV